MRRPPCAVHACSDPLLSASAQKAQYVDPHVEYPCPDFGVVCVVEITEAFWVRYQHASFNLGYLGIEIGRGGEVQ
jgi:hypothetical protein